MKRLVLLTVAFGLALSACTSADQHSLVPPGRDALADFSAYMRQFDYDYEPANTPADLAKQADAVVTGTIVAVTPGQSYAPVLGSRALIATSVLEVKVEQVLAGDAKLAVDGSVYIEVPHPAFVGTGTEGGEVIPFDQAAFAATVPQAYGVFFLADRTNESYSDVILDEGAGRPSGGRITAAFVQGFLIEDANGKLVSVTESLEAMPPPWQALESVDEVVAQIAAVSI